MVRNGIQSYRKTNVMTSDPMRLVLMCYEGAIDSLRIGKERLLQADYEGKSKALLKAQDIITELLCSLDYEKGDAIARNLEALYKYMLRRLMGAGNSKTPDPIDEVIGMLGELKSAWETILFKQNDPVKTESVRPGKGIGEALGGLSI